ncbi:MAG: NAD(P)/FAD-dependent oxidoreductase [Actinobacteria bacterium]|nr:NAD(P)/FAD-dependent oxidoreductase [Actinomycetota bacterium]
MGERAVVIGAGPAGLTAAYELLTRTDIVPVVLEMTSDIGGISKTVKYKGNRMDIGGHRFFSKSDRVMSWWLNIFPLQGAPARDDLVLGREVPYAPEQWYAELALQEKARAAGFPDPEKSDEVMLVRGRISRILYLRKFFDYPITLSRRTFTNMGLARSLKVGFSYLYAQAFPIREERSLEDFFINRFGRELYRSFFKDYTEKVWGVPCQEIKPEWGAQRVKGLSMSKALLHALRKAVSRDGSLSQKDTETSLIERFLYPKLGPGQLWEKVADLVEDMGGRVLMRHRVCGLVRDGGRIVEVVARDLESGEEKRFPADYVFSTMPLRDLVAAMGPDVPGEVREVASRLPYRDFVTVGVLLRKLKVKNESDVKTVNDIVPDNWIYVQERDVKLGRIQIFNNWSPYMVADPEKVWIGLEYFCNEGDGIWSMPDDMMAKFAVDELVKIGFIDGEDVLDHVVVRMPKCYPAYLGSYEKIGVVTRFLDGLENLFPIGRNGMHRYNNQDHSMLTAMMAVDNILEGRTDKSNIWSVNTEQEYHEEK